MASSYCHPALKQLKEQQARFAPRDERLAQIERAETLLGEIHCEKQYPYEYLWYRIKGYRPETAPEILLEGNGVRHDLRLFIEDLSGTVGQTAEQAAEPVLTVDAVSRRYSVSTRTITRWRRQGARGPAVCHRRAHQGRVPRIERQAIRGGAPRPGRPGDTVPTTLRR